MRKRKPEKKQPNKWTVKSLDLQVVGMQHRLTISTRRFLKVRLEGTAMTVVFKREPHNVHDHNAIAVFAGGESREENPYYKTQLGYLPRTVAAALAPAIDSGRAEFGTSLLVSVDELAGTGQIKAKLRVRKNLKVALDKEEIVG